MKKDHWKALLWFALGTFFGGWVLGLLKGLTKAV